MGCFASNQMVETKDRKEQILSTAYEIVGNKGLEALHARSIAAELELNHAAIHYYFAKRPDLLTALCAYALKRFEADLDRVAGERPTAAKKLEAHIALYEAYAKPTSRFFRVLTSLFDAAGQIPEVKVALNQVIKAQQDHLIEDLNAANREGGINPNSPYANAETLGSFLNGLCFRSQLSGGIDPTAQIDFLFASLFKK
jgi:AcrR family transcriptional regulator